MNAAAPALSLRRLRKAFGTVLAVDDVSLDSAAGEFLAPGAVGLRQEDPGSTRSFG